MIDDREYLDVDACAKRMGTTPARIMELVRIRALHAVDYGSGLIFVEPAILSGSQSA